MAKGNKNLSGRRSSSRNTKPYDANNSFVKKVATKVTDLIPQRSWISKWFNTSQNEEEDLEDSELEEVEPEEDVQKPPPLKRPCIRMDVPHPPGTFSIQSRAKPTKPNSTASLTKQQYSIHDETSEDFCKPVMAGPSGMSHLVSSTPATHSNIRNAGSQRSELNSLVSTTNNGTANGMDDNSESSESTSCSSLILQTNRQEAPSNVSYNSSFANNKRCHDDKLSFTNHMQSPRSLFLDNTARDSLSSRRPSFNASVMTNTPDRASPLASPFYSGNITFGGANAAGLYKRGRNLFNSANEVQLSAPKRTYVEVKPSTAAGVDSSGMSQTAKKILEALEHFSSPITDAKKIPLKMMNNTSLTSKKRTREETVSTKVGLRHLTRELTVPTVPDILRLKRRQKLQDTTAAARKIVSARSEPPAPQEYHLRAQDARKDHGFKRKGTYLEEETVEPVNLPNIPLPISSLPNFNFMQPTTANAPDKTSTDNGNTFVFTSPIKISNAVKDLKSINNFTFSSPISADRQLVEDSGSPLKRTDVKSNAPSSDCVPSVAQNFVWSGSSTAPRPKEKVKEKVKNKTPLKTGSVMDVLGTKTEKSCDANTNKESWSETMFDASKQDTVKKRTDTQEINSVWECPDCLSKNSSSEAQCFACKAARSNLKDKKTSTPPSSSASSNANESKTAANDSFGSQFKLTGTQWECASCFVRNKQTDVKCVACNTIKPNAKQETKSNNGGDDKHAEKSWECSDCKSKNPETSSSCTSCNTSKSKMIDSQKNISESKTVEPICVLPKFKDETMIKFKANKDTWECPSCMVRNPTSAESCPCCHTTRPNAGVAVTSAPPVALANGFGDKFKKPEGAWSCDTCMVQNESNVVECVACGGLKPGTKKLENNTTTATSSSNLQFTFGMPVNTGGFKFGVDKANPEKTDSTASTNGFKFGETSQIGSTGQFTFGIQKEEKKSEVQKPENTSTSASGFGVPTDEKSAVKQNVETAEKKPTSVFTFGVPKCDSATIGNDTQSQTNTIASTTISSTFTFGAPKPTTVQLGMKEEKQTPLTGNSVTEASKSNKEATVPLPVTTSAAILSSVTQNISQGPRPIATFPFGLPSGTVAISSTTTVVSSLPSSTQSSFMFMEPKATTQTASSVSFNQPTTTSSVSTLPSTFKFGESKSKEEMPKTFGELQNASPRTSLFPSMASYPTPLFTSNDSKAAPTFGQTSTGSNEQPTFGAASTSKPSTFGTASTSKPSTFAMPENKVPAFGSTESKPSIFGSTETKMPVFESTENKPTSLFNPTPQVATGPTPTPTPFGASSAAPSLFGGPSTVTPVFGNSAASTFNTESTPNIFGSTSKTNETTVSNTNLFTFGTTPAQPVAKPAAGFNFSAAANPAEPPKPLFTFGSTSTTPQTGSLFGKTFNNPASSNTSGFTFNTPKPEAPTFAQPAPTNTIFGASQPDAQNQASSSFSAAPANTGFNFGATATAASSTGGFNFGAAPASAPSTGFTFNPPSSTPTFDPNTPPSFNFTGGNVPPQFNAPPVPQRKIKKAFRRIR
ncbi:nuclear pore complex protein Nup153 [Ceratina calcarata]|uniref:Nuclear pore complex protein Nup153 n=1 Tax=Ceratina calcarata TaxID=156304 RepID=A0AAJ7JCG8_9HYME|nr:nuclear pore complex protein Nup153 [Ceratina calcarata]